MTRAGKKRLYVFLLTITLGVGTFAGFALLTGGDSETAYLKLAHPQNRDPLTGSSWATAIQTGNLRIDLDRQAEKLLTLIPSGSGNVTSELDLAGSNPFYSDRFGIALWPQCEKVNVSISVDPDLPEATRAEMRRVTTEATWSLRNLTGLDIVVTRGATERGEVISKPEQRINAPDEHSLEIHWVDHRNTWLAPDELGTATTWHQLSDLGAKIQSGRVQLSSRIFDSVPDVRRDWFTSKPSRQLVVLHEMSHIFGVGHSTDSNSFMYQSMGEVSNVTPADRAALALVGSRPC